MLKKINTQINIELLKKATHEIMKNYNLDQNQLCFNYTVNCPDNKRLHEGCGSLWDNELNDFRAKESDFIIFNKEFEDTYFAEIYRMMPFKFGRMRLMTLKPRRCYSYHRDHEQRYHIAIDTTPNCFFLLENNSFHIPSDGWVYKVDTRKYHTALNCEGHMTRKHLVFSEVK